MNGVDQSLFLWLNLGPGAPAWLLEAARAISLQWPHWMVAATLAVALTGRPPWRAQAGRVLCSLALAAGAAAALKHGFHLPRPFMLGLGTAWLPHGATAGFPSSHTAAAAAFAASAALAPLRWPVRGLVLASALAMAWSRVALGLHFPSDALAGLCLGLLCAALVQAAGAALARYAPVAAARERRPAAEPLS
ncbi:MAG: phosphatase PAP2 family protein [Proteobacteria bacterium]|nr:phosphatase PAP2 family protein [Pseudomonadota bacterium]